MNQHLCYFQQNNIFSVELFLSVHKDLMANMVKSDTVSKDHCYTDNSTLHGKPSLPNNRNNVASSITFDLDKLNKWGSQNLVSFNANKTQCCLISRRENKNLPDILFGSNTLKMCDSLSMLGVSVASDQSWNEHIASVAKSAARKIGFFSRPCIFSPSTRPNPPLSRIRLSSIERSL